MRPRTLVMAAATSMVLLSFNASGSIAQRSTHDATGNDSRDVTAQGAEGAAFVSDIKADQLGDDEKDDTHAGDVEQTTSYTSDSPLVQAVNPTALTAGMTLTQEQVDCSGGEDAFFWAEEISDETFTRMEGKSFGADCTVPLDHLRYLKMLHVTAEGTITVGEMVVNSLVADEVLDIFHQLYDSKWPIKKMHLIDDYGGSDDASCADGNTASFNFRKAVNADVLSNHAFGLAIDINTFENPYYVPAWDYVYPAEAAPFLDRSRDEPYMIHRGDLCYTLFTERGWDWGGDWSNINDFQHFEKAP